MAENTETENSYYKGANFEKLFAEFMKSDLKWDGYAIRSQQKGKANSRGAQVDIIGYRKDVRYVRLYNLGLSYFIGGIVLLATWALLLVLDDPNTTIKEICLFVGLLGVGGGLYCFWDCKHYKQENAWVECKNRKGKATYDQVQKSIHEYKDYVASGDKEYKFIQCYFVSASGFVDNALKLALDNDFECFEYKEGKFEKITYWK